MIDKTEIQMIYMPNIGKFMKITDLLLLLYNDLSLAEEADNSYTKKYIKGLIKRIQEIL